MIRGLRARRRGQSSGDQPGELDLWVAEGVVDYLDTADDVRSFVSASTAVVLPSYRERMPRSARSGGDGAAALRGGRSRLSRYRRRWHRRASVHRSKRNFAGRVDGTNGRTTAGGLGRNEAVRRKVQDQFKEEFVVQAYLDVLAGLDAAKPRN